MNLTIDIGNTRAKIILFEETEPIYEEVLSESLEEAVKRIISRFHPQRCAWCNVGGNEEEVTRILTHLPLPSTRLTGLTEVPIQVHYQSRATLGADRLAAVLGATTLHPQTDLLIIDAGTCITYDLIDAQGNYWGGNISPGLEMRLKALHQFTARLPLVKDDGEVPPIGNNTETAIRCGVIQGITHEIEGYVSQLRQTYPHLQLFLTGGSKFNFSSPLKEEVLNDPYLVARGLNRLLQL